MQDNTINLALEIDEEIELELTEEPAVNIVPSGRILQVVNPFEQELTDLLLIYQISKL